MAKEKKATTKKTPAKAVKKASPKKAATAKKTDVDARLKDIEFRLEKLEGHDIPAAAMCLYNSVSREVKTRYAENPGMTVAVGLGIVVVILLIFG